MTMRDAAFAFAATVDRAIEQLAASDYHRRSGRAKTLLEELLPLSRLGLHFAFPGLAIEVVGYEDDGPVDGTIIATGYKSFAYDVEVTYARNYEEALRSELLLTQQVVPGAGPIYRDKSTGRIEAAYGALDHDEHIASIAAVLVDLYRKKVAKTYPTGTLLLIAFDEVAVYGFGDWVKLIAAVSAHGPVICMPFRGIYLFNCATNDLQALA